MGKLLLTADIHLGCIETVPDSPRLTAVEPLTALPHLLHVMIC